MDCITDGYINLQAAIIERAVADYKSALKGCEKEPKADDEKAQSRYKKAQKTKRECEKFFLSKWGQTLTNGKGKLIICRCKREAAHEKTRKRKRSDLNVLLAKT